MAAIKVLKYTESKAYPYLKSFLINEQMILDRLKDDTKSAEELGYIQLYDYIEGGRLVEKNKRKENSPDQSHNESSNDKQVGESATAIIEDFK